MQNTIKISLAVVMAWIVGFILAMTFLTLQAAADDGDHNNSGDAMTSEKAKTDNKSNNDSYIYKAQKGDSYSQIARKAVQSYGIENKVNITQAGIVFAETQITKDAKAELLEVGQEVKISKSDVKKQIEAAKKLTKAQQKSWGYYVQFVDFKTDHIGQ